MTDFSARLPLVQLVLSGAVSRASLQPTLHCLQQLVPATGTYVINAEEVTRIELAAVVLVLAFVDDAVRRGSVVRWAASSSRDLFQGARVLATRHAMAS